MSGCGGTGGPCHAAHQMCCDPDSLRWTVLWDLTLQTPRSLPGHRAVAEHGIGHHLRMKGGLPQECAAENLAL